MVSERVTEIDGWGKLVCAPVGALRRSPTLVLSHLVQWDGPLQRAFLMRQIIRRRLGLAVVGWLLALSWTTSSWALTTVPRTFAELVGLADWVLIGTVTQITRCPFRKSCASRFGARQQVKSWACALHVV